LTPKLSERLGQPVVVENRSGSNGNLATETVGKATPDGYTLLLAADAQVVISPHMYTMSVDTLKDLVPVSSLVQTQLVLVVNASLPVKDLREFLDYARRAKPALAYASIGNGSQHHLAMEMLKARANLDLVHVPYKGGGPATIALIAGDVAAMFGGNSVAAQVKAGKMRALALAGKQPAAVYPNVALLGQLYPGLEVSPWLGVFAPAGVATPVLARLRTEIGRMLGEAETRDRFKALGGVMDPFVTTPEEFAAFVRSEHAKYGAVVKAVGVKID
jgi:tripartite-type tricarboxylate transporter receptor subunit TctC